MERWKKYQTNLVRWTSHRSHHGSSITSHRCACGGTQNKFPVIKMGFRVESFFLFMCPITDQRLHQENFTKIRRLLLLPPLITSQNSKPFQIHFFFSLPAFEKKRKKKIKERKLFHNLRSSRHFSPLSLSLTLSLTLFLFAFRALL